MYTCVHTEATLSSDSAQREDHIIIRSALTVGDSIARCKSMRSRGENRMSVRRYVNMH